MTREEHARILATVLEGAADKATTSEAVTTLSEDYAAILATGAVQTAKIATLEAENARLQDQNMKLFLKVGNVPPPEPPPEDDKPKMTFEALYKDMGIETPV